MLPAVPHGDNETDEPVADRLADLGRLWLMLRVMVGLNIPLLALHEWLDPVPSWHLVAGACVVALVHEAQLRFARRATTARSLDRRLTGAAAVLSVAALLVLHGSGEALGLLAFVMVVSAYAPALGARSAVTVAAVCASLVVGDLMVTELGVDLLPWTHVGMGWVTAGTAVFLFFQLTVMASLATERVNAARRRSQALLADLQVAQGRMSETNVRLARWNDELNREVEQRTAELAERERRSETANVVTAAVSEAMAGDGSFDRALTLLGERLGACAVCVYAPASAGEQPSLHRLDLHMHGETDLPRGVLVQVAEGQAERVVGDTWTRADGELIRGRYAAVQLLHRGQAVGALGVLIEGDWPQADADCDILVDVAREFAAAVEHRRALREALARASREALLNDVARVLDETQDTPLALTRALRDVSLWLGGVEAAVTIRASGARRAEILVRARTPGLGVGGTAVDPSAIEHLLLSVPAMVADRGDVLLLARSGEQTISSEVAALGIKAILAVPVFAHRLPAGAVVIIADRDHGWGEAHREVVTRLAQQLGARLEAEEVVRLQARRISELSGLARIGEVVQSTVDPARLFRGFARAASEIFPFDYMYIAMRGDRGLLRVERYDGTGEMTAVDATPDDAEHPWLRLRSATLVEDGDGRPPSFLDEVHRPLVVPMRPKGDALGVVIIDGANGWDAEQLPLASQAISQLALGLDSAGLYQQATERAARIQVLGNLARIAASVVDLRDGFDAFADEIRWLIPFDRAVLFRVDAASGLVEPFAACPDGSIAGCGRGPLEASLVWEAYVARSPLRVTRDTARIDGGADWELLGDPQEVVLVPVAMGDDCVAVLALASSADGVYTIREFDALQEIARLLAVTIERVELIEQAEHAARHDLLTGLPNTRYLHERLEESALAGDVALVLLDMDDLKLFNDRLGHGVGDMVIRRVGDAVRMAARPEDEVARIGGDEFVVLMRGATTDDAQALAARIHATLRTAHESITGAPTAVRASVGIAMMPGDASTTDGLLHAADVAMYAAKYAGGGQTALARSVVGTQFARGERRQPERLAETMVRASTASAAPRERDGIAQAERYALATAAAMGIAAEDTEVLRMLVARVAHDRLLDPATGDDQRLASELLSAMAKEWAGRDPQSAAVARIIAETAVQLTWLQLPEPFGNGCSATAAIERANALPRLALEAAVLHEMRQVIRAAEAGEPDVRAA